MQLGGIENGACNMDYKTEMACKWATCGVLLAVFIGLVSLAGCINAVEFIGSIMAAIVAARLFYFGIRNSYPEHSVHQ